MKIFKRVYYPVMAALVVLMLVLGIVDARVAMSGGKLSSVQTGAAQKHAEWIADNNRVHNSYEASAQQSVIDYITTALGDAGAERVYSEDLDDDGNNTAEYRVDQDGKKYPSFYRQEATVKQSSQVNGDREVAAERTVQNVILAVPGSGADAILLHARTDSSATGGGADAAAVGALLQSATQAVADFKNGKTHQNTLVFLFGDAGQEGDLGAAAFLHQFVGFDNVASKVCAVADFAAGGTGGTLMLYAGENNLNLVGKYAKFNGSTFASSALSSLFKAADETGSGVFGDYNTLTFTNRGGFNRYATASDTTPAKKLVSQQANAMQKFVRAFADAKAADINADSSAVFFSYLDVMTVYYPAAVAFVIAGIILGLVIAIVILNIKNKAFSWGKALAGAAVQLVTLLASALSSLALFYLFALLLSGFGVIPFQSLSSVSFAGTGTLLSAALLAITLSVFFYILLKRTFAIKAADVVRGNTLLFALVAVILSFALPGVSYPFTCVALFALVAMLMTVLFKNKFRNKFSMDIERLFLYVWPIVFALPLFMPLLFAAQTLFPAVSLVVVLVLLVSLAGFIAPFADYLKPTLDCLFKKLPMRTVRYERTVTERVEDRAKKGKFTEVSVKKIVKEKEPWTYRNRIGLSAVCVIAAVMIVLFSSFTTTFSSAADGTPSYYDAIYNDSLLFVYEKEGDAAARTTVEVHDKIAYNYIRYAVNDLDWNAEKGAYVKNYNGAVSDIIPSAPDFTKSGDAVNFTVFDSAYSQITVTLRGATAVTGVTFNKGSETRESEQFTFARQEEITFRLPYGYEDFSMTIEGSYTDIVYEQHVYNDKNLQGVADNDWDKVYEYYGSNKEVGPAIQSGIVIRIVKSL